MLFWLLYIMFANKVEPNLAFSSFPSNHSLFWSETELESPYHQIRRVPFFPSEAIEEAGGQTETAQMEYT